MLSRGKNRRLAQKPDWPQGPVRLLRQPAVFALTQHVRLESTQSSPYNGSMPDLLLVDNDPRITELTSWFLRRKGHEVRIASSYREARALLQERTPELLLADLELGEETGWEELPRLAEEGILPPTLVVSGFLDAELSADLARIPSVVGTVAKPFDIEELEREIERHLNGSLPVPTIQDSRPPSTPIPQTEDEDGWVEIVPFGEENA